MKSEATSLKMQILKGTFILAAAGLVTRMLGLYNRVFLANVIGAASLGVYQMIFPVFMVCHSICCSGIETALSRLVAAYGGKNCHGNIRRLVKLAVGVSMALAAALAAAVYIFAEPLSIYLLKEPLCAPCLRILAPVLLFSTAHSCVLGYFYGLKRAAVPAISQLLEQVCRVSAIYFLSVSVYTADAAGAMLAVWGMLAGDGISCVYTLLSYKIHVRRLNMRLNIHCAPDGIYEESRPLDSYGFLFRRLMGDALPLTANRLSLTLLQSVEAILIPLMMKLFYTVGDRALELYGIVTGMALPFIMFPTTITNALASMLLPTVAEAAERKAYGLIRRAVSQSVHYCLLIGMGGMAVFMLYGQGLGTVFFKNEMAGELLSAFAVLCPFTYISAALSSVLNGLGKTQLTLLHNVISVGIRILFVIIFVPRAGVSGYLWGLFAASLVLCVLHFVRIWSICGLQVRLWRSMIFPAVAALLSGYVSLGIYKLLLLRAALPAVMTILLSCLCLGAVYGGCLWVSGCLKNE